MGGLVIYDELSKNNLLLIINTYIFSLLTFQINIPVWIIFLSLLLVVGFSFLFLAGRRSLPSYRTLSVKKNIKKAYSKSIISNILNEGFIPNNIKLEILGYQQNDPSLAYKKNLCANTYEPGTFTLAEISPDAKFIKNPTTFSKWLDNVFLEEIEVLKRRYPSLIATNINIGEVKETLKNILECKTNTSRTLKHEIWYQEYSDIIRRILFFIIKSDPDYEIDLYPNLTYKRKKNIFDVVKYISENKRPEIRDWLRLSIAAGLMGVDEKSVHLATSEINRGHVISLDNQDEKYSIEVERISSRVWDVSCTETKIDVSEWLFHFFQLSVGMSFRLIAFSDDYIETIFLLQYYNELIKGFLDIEIDLVPRSIKCGNDATYDDVVDFLNYFPELKSSPRFRVHKNGPKLATVNLLKLHPSIMSLIEQSDLIDVRGARNFEMMQGIKKDTCFGFMVCREFSESVIGLKSEKVPLVYIKQSSGEKSFMGFRERNNRLVDGLMLCRITAEDNKKKLQGGHLLTYKNWTKEKKERFEINQSFYRRNALDFHKKYGDHLEVEVKNYLNEFSGKILVVGCGSGKEVNYLHRLSCQPIGIDFSFEAIRIAQELYPGLWDKFMVEDLYNLELYDNNFFDGIVFNAALVHLLDKEDLFTVLCNTKNILRNDGLCYLRVIEKKDIDQEYDNTLFENPRWFVYCSLDEIVSICNKLQFTILKTDRRLHVQYEHVYWISVLIKNKKN